MSLDDRAKIAEALAQLEEERERRINAKVDAGKAIRVNLLATVTQDLEARKAQKRAEFNTEREIIFDTMVVNTGVPRTRPGEQPLPRVTERTQTPEARPSPEPVRPVARVPDMREPKRITATIPPRSEADFGVVFFGAYRVEAGQVHVQDQDGKPLGSLPINPSDDVELIARRLLREKLSGGGSLDFLGRINYPKLSIH